MTQYYQRDLKRYGKEVADRHLANYNAGTESGVPVEHEAPDLCPICGAYWKCDCVRLYLTDAEFHAEVEIRRVVSLSEFVIDPDAMPAVDAKVFENLKSLGDATITLEGTWDTEAVLRERPSDTP